MATLRTVLAAGGVKVRNLIGELVLSRFAEDNDDSNNDNYDDDEALMLAKSFQSYLKTVLRTNLFRVSKNTPFTSLIKGRSRPLYNSGELSEGLVYIRKLSVGYRVGFDLQSTHSNGMAVSELLNILENGKDLTGGSESKKLAVGRYVWYKLNQAGIKKLDGKAAKNERKDFKIPPRPFFDKAVKIFMSANKSNAIKITPGHYCLNIQVIKSSRRV